jgi:hypothetical protein
VSFYGSTSSASLKPTPTIGLIYVETNQGGELWPEVFHGLPVKVKTIHQTIKKEIRAARALGHYQRGRVLHSHRLAAAEEQLVAFPKAAHYDIVDAISAGVSYFLCTAHDRNWMPVALPLSDSQARTRFLMPVAPSATTYTTLVCLVACDPRDQPTATEHAMSSVTNVLNLPGCPDIHASESRYSTQSMAGTGSDIESSASVSSSFARNASMRSRIVCCEDSPLRSLRAQCRHLCGVGGQLHVKCAHRVLKPGGRLLIADLQAPTYRGSGFARRLFRHHALDEQPVDQAITLMTAAGFTNVTREQTKVSWIGQTVGTR